MLKRLLLAWSVAWVLGAPANAEVLKIAASAVPHAEILEHGLDETVEFREAFADAAVKCFRVGADIAFGRVYFEKAVHVVLALPGSELAAEKQLHGSLPSLATFTHPSFRL